MSTKATPNASPKTLIIAPNWVGDAVMTQPLLADLKRKSPDRAIDVLAPAYTKAVYQRMAQVNEVLTLPFGHGDFKWFARRAFAQSIRNQYAQAIVLPNSWKSALVPWFADITQRTGWRGEFRYGVLNDVRVMVPQALPLLVQRYAALALTYKGEPATHVGMVSTSEPALQFSQANRDRLVRELDLDVSKPIIAFCPGAEYGPAKRWPAAYFGALANELLATRAQVWIFGGPKDVPLAREIQQIAGERCVDLTGKTKLEDAIDLLSLPTQVVTNDSGLMHVAAALGRRIVAIFGSSSPQYTPPLTKLQTTLSNQLPCRPCFKRECPLGHTNCLNGIESQRVHAAIKLHL
jgi:heptosyltransferase II